MVPTYRRVDGTGVAAGTDGSPTTAGLKYSHYVISILPIRVESCYTGLELSLNELVNKMKHFLEK
jgi:hypothetical protein